MRVLRLGAVIVIVLVASMLRAQLTAPAVSQSIATQSLVAGDTALTLDLRNYFSVPGINGPVVQFDTVFGTFLVQLRPDAAPLQVANFLGYVNAGAYTRSFFHRAASLDGTSAVSIVQGGGFVSTGGSNVSAIAANAPVPLEYNLPNARGTLAAARTSDVNSATSQWYFNVRDDSDILGPANGGGYTVFGQVLGDGMSVVDQIAALPRVNAGSAFTDLPVRNYTSGTPTDANLVIVNSVTTATVFPTGGGTSLETFSLENSAPSVVATTLSGSTLTLTPLAAGAATLSVRATDPAGVTADMSFTVNVTAVPPSFLIQPVAQTVAAGSTVVFSSSARDATRFQWRFNGADLPGATNATLVISPASGSAAGSYAVVASNVFGEATSDTVTLQVVEVPETAAGRLINLSVLTPAGAGADVLTVGAVIGPVNSSNSLPIIVRAVGPTLANAPFNVGGTLPDPQLTLLAAKTPIASNDDWGGGTTLADAFTSVGAFPLPAGSADAAVFQAPPGVPVGDYTIQVSGKGDAQGMVLAELYDAAGATRTAATPRLINLSVLKRLDAGGPLTAGFVVSGQTARTVLVRAIGPSLAEFNVASPMRDPRLALFKVANGTRTKIAENDNWGGALQFTSIGDAVGAFEITNRFSTDAMILITLPPGDYTVQVDDASDTTGTALVEVYAVP